MIFAAGLGTRLKPLTDTMPKALVPVGGKPLLEILIRKLVASGFTEIVINVHHFADQIITHELRAIANTQYRIFPANFVQVDFKRLLIIYAERRTA